ncbi:MAG: phosphoglucosamine mutase [Oscillospiraceae bacterium]|jgi:phosphoglucosamine mutase|nr:phosphoglucosamine mutase [Oscillospiraceae bacterium]
MGRLFGTDGARGIANTELTCELALQIGRACGGLIGCAAFKNTVEQVCLESARPPKVLIGMDTRASSSMLAAAMAAGLNSVGVDAVQTGVAPTPAVAYLVPHGGYSAGVMISASHNPCEYNGIKLFQADGHKLPDALEEQIEAVILDETAPPPAKIGGQVGRTLVDTAALSAYLDHLCATVSYGLARDLAAQGRRRIALDCANGSASATAPELFRRLGFAFDLLAAAPDGVNINADCGSTHTEALRAHVRSHGLDAGFAFDGDADRLLAVDENGALVDGDKIIAICAKQWKAEGRLRRDSAVVTVMSNLGFHTFCQANHIACETTAVGDRYVLERMTEKGYSIGGEQSGHIIFSDFASTGDGQLTALQLLEVMRKTGRPLSALAGEIETFPQVMVNLKVSQLGKLRCNGDAEIQNAVCRAEAELGKAGRVLVRVSGTEPLIRVMIEGRDAERIRTLAQELADVVKARLL